MKNKPVHEGVVASYPILRVTDQLTFVNTGHSLNRTLPHTSFVVVSVNMCEGFCIVLSTLHRYVNYSLEETCHFYVLGVAEILRSLEHTVLGEGERTETVLGHTCTYVGIC